MKKDYFQISAIATAVTLGISAMTAQAASPPSLGSTSLSGTSSAMFHGGATVNGGASYLTSIPSSDAVDVIATITPRSADVGQTGHLVALAVVPGLGTFQMLSGGLFVPWDGSVEGLRSFTTKTLSASEQITVLDGLIAEQANLAGISIQVFVGYYVDSVQNIQYSANPVNAALASPPAAGCPDNTTAAADGTFKDRPVCILSGRITSDTHLTANNSYLLDGQVIIGENEVSGTKTKLIIDSGTWVFGQTGLNYLVVDRNAEIHANGSAEKPVIFTYEGDDTATATTSGQWGGIVINGSAPINEGTGTAEGEGSSGLYGGDNSADSSGSLTYVQVKYAGQNFTETNELNGIAFQAVGHGTNLDYIQVHNNSDDGVEFFGGTVNAKHLVLTGNEDDSLDWTYGWNGKVQHVVVMQTGGRGDFCIEADSNDDNNDAAPRSHPTIANMTCVGKGADGVGIRLREGTAADLRNFVMTGFNDICIDIDGAATFTSAGGSLGSLNGNLTLRNSRLDSFCAFEDEAGEAFTASGWFDAQTGSSLGVVDLGGPVGWANGSAINSISPSLPTDEFFDNVDHIGAIKDGSSDWTEGWTLTDF